MKYIIEDEFHVEHILNKEFDNFEDALKEIVRFSKIPWDIFPNRCPCTNWRTCQRDYVIIPNIDQEDYQLILSISSKEKKWHYKHELINQH